MRQLCMTLIGIDFIFLIKLTNMPVRCNGRKKNYVNKMERKKATIFVYF
jgi:hypothetical protein